MSSKKKDHAMRVRLNVFHSVNTIHRILLKKFQSDHRSEAHYKGGKRRKVKQGREEHSDHSGGGRTTGNTLEGKNEIAYKD